MSALPPKADIREHRCRVCFVPILLKKPVFTNDQIIPAALMRPPRNYVGGHAINSLSNGRVSQPPYKAVGLTPRGFNAHRAKLCLPPFSSFSTISANNGHRAAGFIGSEGPGARRCALQGSRSGEIRLNDICPP